MMEDSSCESFEPLDLPHVSTHGDEEPKSSESITPESPNFTIEPVSSLLQLVSLAIFHSFPKVYSRKRPFQNKSTHKNFIVSLNTTIIPNIVFEALTKKEWKDVMREEMNALEKNKTWEIVERLKGKNIVDCKWIFTLKYKADGSLERRKARLVAKGYTQTYGVDYQETFVPAAKMNTINNEFEIKELGKLKYFLGIEVAYSTQGIFISQQKYVTDLLAETRKIGCKRVSTLMDPNHKLGEAKEEPVVEKRMYQRLVGRLIYLDHTWPDIAYSVNMISQLMHDPREPHLQAAYRVLHYLKGNPRKGILFKKNNTLALKAYTDVDYAGFLVDRRSTTGYCTFLRDNMVTWRSKSECGSKVAARIEFRAIAQGLCELLWLKIILYDLRIKWDGPMKLYCDNKSAINIAHNPIQHDRTKHIEIDKHFIKEKLDEGVVSDIITKGLNNSMFHDLVFKLGMEDIYSSR
ncbi:hypothetical protein AAG906_035856 [Vitis piasezkii]